MKTTATAVLLAVISITALGVFDATAQPELNGKRSDGGLQLTWPGEKTRPDGEVVRPYFELQRSTDLNQWEPIGLRARLGVSAASGTQLSVFLPAGESHAFFRLLAVEPQEGIRLAESSEAVFGYAEAFDQELARIGQIAPEEFAAAYASDAQYLPGISWDPTTGQYWDLFNTDPEVYNEGLIPGVDDVRLTDFRLNFEEMEVFKKNGFVVSQRLGSHSFADVFYRLWKDDLPVFVSTDAVLQAWHRTYDMMLEEVEETFLFASMDQMLTGMAEQVPAAWEMVGSGELAESVRDADYFLTVARSLLLDPQDPVPSLLGQDGRVATTLAAIAAEEMAEFDLFGTCRVVDFSQFKVRGHYENSGQLGRYFQCLMWLGRIDLRIAGGPFEDCLGSPHMASPREMGGAVVLWHLLQQSGEFETWLNMDRTIQAFVGWTDSLTFAQLDQLLAAAEIDSIANVPDLAAVERIQQLILSGELGAQTIRSDFFVSPVGTEQIQLPRSFTVFGQKFALDSWALSKVVFDDILWTEDGVSYEVCRRIPSALDVAFAVLGNDQIVPEILARITDPDAPSSADSVVRLRDGLPYQHNLAAVRNVIDAQAPTSWSDTITLGWLNTLRTLSAPTTDERYPEAMRTRAWAMKTLNTQLAAWTQLRHDTILYAKQSYTGGGDCSYPHGYVEPRLEFWARLRQLALHAQALIQLLPYEGEYTYPIMAQDYEDGPMQIGEETVSLAFVQERQIEHLQRFATTVEMLGGISQKQLHQQCLDDVEVDFLRDLIEEDGWLPTGGSSRMRIYDGWYPRLFYRKISEQADDPDFHSTKGAEADPALVADVHTDVPSVGCASPGHVLHEGVGQVHLLMMAVENGDDRIVVAGPVLSHYEFAVDGVRRLTDNEWRWQARASAPNEWTKGYLVPGEPQW